MSDFNFELLTVATIHQHLAPRVEAVLASLGFRSPRPLQWLRRTELPFHPMFMYSPLKGAVVAPRWGFCLDFVPHLAAGRVKWHRTAKSSRLDVWVDGQGPGLNMSYMRGVAGLLEGHEERIAAALDDARAFWDQARTVPELYTLVEELAGKRETTTHTQMPITAAICLARQGRETEGRAVLAECITSRDYGNDTAAELWRVFDEELGADAAAQAPATRRRPSAPRPLSPLELVTVAELLEGAATEHAGHGSNDYWVAASATNRSVITAVIDFGNEYLAQGVAGRFESSAEADGRLFVWDHWLMSWLARRAREAAAAGNALTDAELPILGDLLEALAANRWKLYEEMPEGEDFSLSASAEHAAFIAAAIRHGARAGWRERVAALDDASAGGLVAAHTVDVLGRLAARCREGVGGAAVDAAPAPAPDPVKGGRLGVLRGWISEKTLCRRATEQDASWIPAFAKNDADIATYAAGGNPFREYDDENVPCLPPFARPVSGTLLLNAQLKFQRAAVLSMFGSRTDMTWQAEFDGYAAYSYWRRLVEVYDQGAIDFEPFVLVLVDCLQLGQLREAQALVTMLDRASRRDQVRAKHASPLFHWILRIAFDHWGLDPLPIAPAGERILDQLAAHWRDTDLAPFARELIWLCDYYTHRTRYVETDAPGGPTEFGTEWIAARLPGVILAWFRLREARGLANPLIEHPLMTPRYAQLRPPRTLYTDPVLEQTIARLRREELPGLPAPGDPVSPDIPPPPLHPVRPDLRRTGPFASLALDKHWAPGFGLTAFLPLDWKDRCLPELLRYREPDTGTEFAFSGYRNPGLSARQWAERRQPVFAATSPGLTEIRAPYEVVGTGWWGWAAEYQGRRDPEPTSPPVRVVILCLKSRRCLLSLTVTATVAAFSAREELYRWLLQWQIFIDKAPREADLWLERQDMPGFVRIARWRELLGVEKQFEGGLAYYHGFGDSETAKAATRDKACAAEWFERAAEQGLAKAQYNLALLLGRGDGVPKDLPRALVWCRKAVAQGHENARKLLSELEADERKANRRWKFW